VSKTRRCKRHDRRRFGSRRAKDGRMTSKQQNYWFRAKGYGWGWGLPGTWQGRGVLILWLTSFILGGRYLVPRNLYAHLAFSVAMVGLLLSICYKKGEPPRWRFGDRD
jgi:hypothetical protein